MHTIQISKREALGKAAKSLAAEGLMPAVVYGPKQETVPVSLNLRDFVKTLRDVGVSSVVELKGLEKPIQVLIHEVDRDPVTDVPRHVDFYAIEKGAKVEVAIPVVFVGESPAVKLGGSLVKVLHEIEIEASAENLINEIEVDISVLAEMGSQIHVSDLKVPHGVEIKTDGEEVIVLVQEAVAEEETSAAGPDMSAIEVEKKGKEESTEAEA